MKPDSTVYRGYRCQGKPLVVVSTVRDVHYKDVKQLTPDASLKVRNHSPDGFEWGYSGSGPSQLALALLLDFTGDEQLATFRYHDFKFTTISAIGQLDDWKLTGLEIRLWLERQQHGRPFEPIPDEPPYEDLPDYSTSNGVELDNPHGLLDGNVLNLRPKTPIKDLGDVT